MQATEDLRDADNRELFGVDDGVASRSPHAVSAHPEELKSWKGLCGDSRPRLSGGAKLRSFSLGSPLQCFNQLRPIHFPGSFAG